MIKCILFDLDGVLVGAKEWHYESLNRSLQTNNIPIITRAKHIEIFDGLPTRSKIQLIQEGALGDKYEIPDELATKINKDKQVFTIDCIKEYCKPDHTKIEIMQRLCDAGIKVGCCSNSIRETLELMLKYSGLVGFMDIILSNQDVDNPKPDPEMYIKAMAHLGTTPEETLIVEDNFNGKKAAHASGANVLEVKDETEVHLKNLRKAMALANYKDLQILIPMAGKGTRFAKVGYTRPKPLIPVLGMPMIGKVIKNLQIEGLNLIWNFVCLQEHVDDYNIDKIISGYCEKCNIITEVKEKQVISDHATVGIYLWNKAQYFIDGVGGMIDANDTHNNEFYVAPSYNYTICDGKRYTIAEIKQTEMWGLGTPEDLIQYVESHA